MNRLVTIFVAGFIGSPAMNMIEGRVQQGVFVSDDGAFQLEMPGIRAQLLPDRGLVLGIRPEDIYLVGGPYTPEQVRTVQARVDVVEPMGNEIYLYASAAGHELVARVAPQVPPRPDSDIALAIDTARLHFFDRDNGQRV